MYSVGVVSLGCSKNRVDTELMLHILEKAGYRITANEREADILIVNTCGFIDPAKQESIDTLLELAQYKTTGRLKLLVATGCLVQRYEKALLEELPEIDLLLGVSQYPMLPQAIEQALRGKRASYCAQDMGVLSGERVLTTAPYTAYVRIADGCDNRCAYCAIPLIRGGFRSRDMQDVLTEIRRLADSGVREHVLVAQDTSRFGIDRAGRSLLPELMQRAADIPGVEWLRVLYCYPDEVDGDLLTAMASRPNICRYLDLPLQHADPDLLRRMNRRGDIEETRAFLKKAREMGFTLRTTFITGFPGETDRQFERLMDFVRDIRFDRLGAFTYSMEEDTPAASMPDQIPEEVKQARLDTLMTEQQSISLERNLLRVGGEERVLVESVNAEGVAEARSAAEAPETDGVIRLSGASQSDIGCFVKARITAAEPYDLIGEIL
ncbi:MAG: 30S ribosomal protein S12 methylthiotransferase RimO [Clostridiales bacterium]|nr:30S ribosomal protein S12 methylthiotransferase RimO [Clostridiales bacterium]